MLSLSSIKTKSIDVLFQIIVLVENNKKTKPKIKHI